MQPVELKFKFNIDDTKDQHDYHIVTNAQNYHDIIKDLDGWIDKTIRNSDYSTQDIDEETLEYIQAKLHEIALNYQITL